MNVLTSYRPLSHFVSLETQWCRSVGGAMMQDLCPSLHHRKCWVVLSRTVEILDQLHAGRTVRSLLFLPNTICCFYATVCRFYNMCRPLSHFVNTGNISVLVFPNDVMLFCFISCCQSTKHSSAPRFAVYLLYSQVSVCVSSVLADVHTLTWAVVNSLFGCSPQNFKFYQTLWFLSNMLSLCPIIKTLIHVTEV